MKSIYQNVWYHSYHHEKSYLFVNRVHDYDLVNFEYFKHHKKIYIEYIDIMLNESKKNKHSFTMDCDEFLEDLKECNICCNNLTNDQTIINMMCCYQQLCGVCHQDINPECSRCPFCRGSNNMSMMYLSDNGFKAECVQENGYYQIYDKIVKKLHNKFQINIVYNHIDLVRQKDYEFYNLNDNPQHDIFKIILDIKIYNSLMKEGPIELKEEESFYLDKCVQIELENERNLSIKKIKSVRKSFRKETQSKKMKQKLKSLCVTNLMLKNLHINIKSLELMACDKYLIGALLEISNIDDEHVEHDKRVQNSDIQLKYKKKVYFLFKAIIKMYFDKKNSQDLCEETYKLLNKVMNQSQTKKLYFFQNNEFQILNDIMMFNILNFEH